MKRCTVAHVADGFGDIPVGSLWADDSPFVGAEDCFEDADTPDPEPYIPKPVRKFAAKKAVAS